MPVPAGPMPKVMSCLRICLQVFGLARRAAAQVGAARAQVRAGAEDRIRLLRAADAADGRLDLRQAELDVFGESTRRAWR